MLHSSNSYTSATWGTMQITTSMSLFLSIGRSPRIGAEFSTVMSFGNETLIAACSVFISFRFSSLYETGRFALSWQRFGVSLLRSVKPLRWLVTATHKTWPVFWFPLQPLPAHSIYPPLAFSSFHCVFKTVVVFLYVYLNHCRGWGSLFIYIYIFFFVLFFVRQNSVPAKLRTLFKTKPLL